MRGEWILLELLPENGPLSGWKISPRFRRHEPGRIVAPLKYSDADVIEKYECAFRNPTTHGSGMISEEIGG